MSEVTTIPVRTAGGSYDVRIGEGLLAEAGPVLAATVASGRVALVTDETVAGLFGKVVRDSLTDAGVSVRDVVVVPGERSKDWATAGRVLEDMAAVGLDRGDAVVALGGGVIGDLAGFCSSAYMRGIPYLQLPTTLLAQVDSSVGGKTAVDLAAGKNLAGSFWQPAAVLADVTALTTLPDAEWANGLAEVVKAGLLIGGETLEWLEANADGLRRRDVTATHEAIRLSVAFKASVVEADERETGGRECLNLGHTLGHAVERLEGYAGVPHGAAIAYGIRFAAHLAERIAGADPGWSERQRRVLDEAGIPRLVRRYDTGELLAAMHSDKKRRAGKVRFVLSTGPGEWNLVPVDDDVLSGALDAWDGSEKGT